MAKRYWPEGDAVGRHVTMLFEKSPREVVGVVGDTHQSGLEWDVTFEAYVPNRQLEMGLTTIAVRSGSDARF